MGTVTNSFDNLMAAGDIDNFLLKAKELTEKKVYGKKFAGMGTEDVVQEALIKVHRELSRYDSARGKVSTFVDHIIEMVIYDCYRKCASNRNLMVVNAAQLADFVDMDDETMAGAVVYGEVDYEYDYVTTVTDIMTSMGLDDREKEIFRLRASGYSFVEISQYLKLSKARVSQLWKGILQKYDSL